MNRKLATATTAAAIASLIAAAAPAHAADIDMTVDAVGTDWTAHHEFDMTYVCGADGTVTFSGFENGNPSGGVSGFLDTTNRTFTYQAQDARLPQFVVTVTGGGTASGGLSGTGKSGTIAYAGDGTDTDGRPAWTATGNFHNVPLCAVVPVAGNHGEYVAGAAKAGIKGAALAAIAQDKTKIGPYPG